VALASEIPAFQVSPATNRVILDRDGGSDKGSVPLRAGHLETTAMSSTHKFEGQIQKWSLSGTERKYLVTTVPFDVVNRFTKASPFSATTGEGEQRKRQDGHVRKLREEMAAGRFTPTPISAGLRATHLAKMKLSKEKVTLEVSFDDPLPLTDGFQRISALKCLLEAAEKKQDIAGIRELQNLPVTIMVYLDGNTQTDFINLNQGKPVDTTHLFSLRYKNGLLSGKHQEEVQVAIEAARMLNANPESPYDKALRFDDGGTAPIPLRTVCALGASDVASSLIGVALAGKGNAEATAKRVVSVYQALKAHAPELLERGKLLAPPLPHGTKGSATMLAGVTTCLAYRLQAKGDAEPSPAELESVALAAKKTLAGSVEGNMSGPGSGPCWPNSLLRTSRWCPLNAVRAKPQPL